MLDSYINKGRLANITTETTPEYLKDSDLNLISEYLYCSAPYNSSDNKGLSVEFHVYTPNGNYLKSLYNCDYQISTNQLSTIDVQSTLLRTTTTLRKSVNNNPVQCKVLLDLNTLIQNAGYYTGQFNVLTNIFVNIIGSSNGAKLYINEISTDRTEVQLAFTDENSNTLSTQFDDANDCITKEILKNHFSTYLLNFGHNITYQIVNFHFETYAGQHYVYLKLYKPLSNNIKVKNTCWIAEEVAKPSIFPIRILQAAIPEQYNTLRGPNFDIDVSNDSTATDYKTWDDLIGNNTITTGSLISPTQQILNTYFSGSLSGIQLNINYRYFKNFVHFSSAEQRVKNFIFKLRQIDWYDTQITNQSSILSASKSTAVSNIETLKIKRDNIISLFDDFEKYLYFDQSSSTLYSNYNESNEYYIKPYPKTASGSLYPYPNYNVLHTTDTYVENYFEDLIKNARIYDQQNVHALINTVPMFIRNDENNDQYELFIHMIGQYYDVLWSYINSLHDINTREENPFDGMPNDLLWHVAQSLGMKLYNGWQDTDLIDYELDNNKLFSKKQNTYNVWRRILNNLPYLYKLKGTKQCIYALMSCFGLPNTFLTIKEYGGPTTDALQRNNNDVTYQKDINIGSLTTKFIKNGNQTNNIVSASINFELQKPYYYIEFQARTDSNYQYTPNASLSIIELYDNTTPLFELKSKIVSTKNHSFDLITYVKLKDITGRYDTKNNKLIFNDNDWYTFVIGPFAVDSNDAQQINIIAKKQKYGQIIDSATLHFISDDTYRLPSANIKIKSDTYQPLQIRQLRIWQSTENDINKIDIDNHTLNPNAYNNSFTSDDYNLAIFPLTKQYTNVITTTSGSTTTTTTYLLTSVNTIKNKSAYGVLSIYDGVTVDDCFENNNEVAYIRTPSLGNDTLYNNKIRIETNYIPIDSATGVRLLSNSRRNESSSFDNYSLDSNVVGIYYSPTDQLNNDIYNQLGYWNLEDYIGDPSDVWKAKYTELSNKYNEYISTIDSIDLNSYFDILKEYDFTIFKYIENMIPMRCDLIDGVVIEQSVLERSKFTIGKEKHEVKNNSYSSSINLLDNYEISSLYNNLPIATISSSYATISGIDGDHSTIQLTVSMSKDRNLMKLKDGSTINNNYTKYTTFNHTTTYMYSSIATNVTESRCDDTTINGAFGKQYVNNTSTAVGKSYYWNGASNFDYENTGENAIFKYGILQGVNLDKSIRIRNLKFDGCKVTEKNNIRNQSELPLNNWTSPIQITYVNDNTIISNTAGQTTNKYNRIAAVNNVLPANNVLINSVTHKNILDN